MAEECHAEETKHLGDSSFRFAALRMTQWRRNVMLSVNVSAAGRDSAQHL
ncbi:hypothetical protein [Lyngbya aestuarii]